MLMTNAVDLLTDRSHLLSTALATLYILKTLLLALIYYRLHRKDRGQRLLRRIVIFAGMLVRKLHAARFIRHRGVRIISGLLAVFFLLLPFITINLTGRLLLREVRIFHLGTTVNLSHLDWIKNNILSLSVEMLIVTVLVGFYAMIDLLVTVETNKTKGAEHEQQDNLIRGTRFVTVRRFWMAIRKSCERVAGIKLYRYVWNVIVVCCILGWIQLAITSDVLPRKVAGGRVEPMEDSPRREMILTLVKEAGVSQIPLQVEHFSETSTSMNARGTYKYFGARILFFSNLLEGLNDEEILFITAHELYHVRHFDRYTIGGIVLLFGCSAVILFIGPPKPVLKGGGIRAGRHLERHLITRVPLYVLIFVTTWLVFQAVRCALARPHEAEADRYATQLTVPRKVSLDSAKSSLIKISRSNLRDPDPYWFDKWLFYDHPPLKERLQIIDEASGAPTADGQAAAEVDK